jgi:SAM-dependent methyltransferase
MVTPPPRPVVVLAASQGAAFCIAWGVAWTLLRAGGPKLDPVLLLAIQGAIAAVLGLRFGLANWWLPVQLALPLAAGAALMLKLPSWVFLAAFVLLVLVFWNARGERVPLYLSNRRTWTALADLAPTEGAIVDLGCGIGGTLTHLARAHPQSTVTGIESAPIPFVLAWLRVKLSGLRNIRLMYGDIWRHDLAPYAMVYAFLSPAPMPELHAKARAEMRPGTMLVSNSFEVPGHAPDETRELDDSRRTRLLIWRM